MTAIAALIHNNEMWMGSDSLDTNSNNVMYPGQRKIWIAEEAGIKWLFGCAGSLAFQQAVRYEVQLPTETPADDMQEFLVTKFIPSLRELLTKRKDLFDSNGNVIGGGIILIGLNEQLFLVSGFGVCKIAKSYTAIGSGGATAYGVLHFISEQRIEMAPEEQLRHAIKAADDRNSTVGGEYHVLSV